MTAVGETDLATKCLDFCQTLSSRGSAFKFSLTMGSNFSFSLDTKVLTSDIQVKYLPKKKPSPSTIRRNARRREMFLSKKRNPAPSSPARPLQHPPEVPTPEKERLTDAIDDLHLTPVLGEGREEPPSPASTPVAAEETMATPVATMSICDLPLKSGGGAKCFEIWSREHGLPKCGKSFQNENDLIVHAENNHNYCLEHERMWYKCLPCKLREHDNNLL